MQDELLEAKKKAMALLKYMDRTEWQLRDKLTSKGFSEEAVEEAFLRVIENFVECHHEERSRQRLRQDLYPRHVPEKYIDQALEMICENDDAALQKALYKITH